MQRYVDFLSAKRGLGSASRSGDPAYERLLPAVRSLHDAGATVCVVRDDAFVIDGGQGIRAGA